MAYTISAHFGKKISRNHNIRSPKVVKNEKHINKDGYFKIIEDKTLRQAYHDLFGDAVAEYNAKQTRRDRLVTDYLSKVQDHYKLNPDRHTAPAQEAIFTIGNVNEHPPVEVAEKVLTEFLERWKQKNPNMYVYGAYFHADEPGAAPHMHVDFILFKEQNSRGLSRQVSQIGALREMGIENIGKPSEKEKFVTAQTQWQKRTRDTLRGFVKKHGLQLETSRGGIGKDNKRKHLDTDIYKKETKLRELNTEVERLEFRKEQFGEKWAEVADLVEENQQLELENKRLRADNVEILDRLKNMNEALYAVKEYIRTLNLQSGKNLWKKAKEKIFDAIGKEGYDRWNATRHERDFGGYPTSPRGTEPRLRENYKTKQKNSYDMER